MRSQHSPAAVIGTKFAIGHYPGFPGEKAQRVGRSLKSEDLTVYSLYNIAAQGSNIKVYKG